MGGVDWIADHSGATVPRLVLLAVTRVPGVEWPDIVVVLAYIAIVLWMGWRCSRGQEDDTEYFVAARRHLPPFLVGISTFATMLSTISYLAKPGEMINKGPYLLVGQILSVPFAYVIVGYWVVPRLMRQRVTSAYELLEERLGLAIRLTGSFLFIVLRLAWMGLLVHLASVALVVILALDPVWTPIISAVSGFVAVVYSSLGGLRAVVLTDLFQFSLLLFGALLTIAIVTMKFGGFSWFPTEWSPHWDRQLWFSTDPTVRVTVFGSTLALVVWRVATASSDQVAIQRYMATRDASAARRSYLVTEGATLVVATVLALLGLALLGFFSRPGNLGPGMTLARDADRLFPFFISAYIPAGLCGLLVSAMLAAAMSSVDSGVNSITAVVVRDWMQRLGWRASSPAAGVSVSRWMSFGIGLIVVAASLLMKHVPGNFQEMTMKVSTMLTAPIFALFVMALWVPFSTPLGAFLGCAYGVATAVAISFWQPLTGRTPISFQWIGPAALAVDLLVGIAVSRWGPARGRPSTAIVGAAGLALLGALGFALVD